MAESDLIRGNVDTVILKVLYEGDRYGYDLIKRINERSGGQWEVKQPTVYACLKRLEKQGFVSSYWDSSESEGGRRKYFSLTDSGREVFVKYKNEWERSRDLFGELITGSAPIMPTDDYADVEEESYSVPKRRVQRERRNVAKQTKVEPETTEQEQFEPQSRSEAIELSEDDTESPSPVAEPDYPQENNEFGQFVQESFFDNEKQYADDVSDYVGDTQNDKQTARATAQEPPVTAADPHEIMRELYAATYTGNKSYSDAHASLITNDYDYRRQSEQAQPKNTAQQTAQKTTANSATAQAQRAPAPVEAAPAPQNTSTSLLPVDGNLPDINSESQARREYKYVLSDLVERFESTAPTGVADSVSGQAAEQAAVAADRTEVTRFYKIEQAVRELGNEVTVREHSDSAKEYTHKFYYYSNRLMMMHYMIMCGSMFLVGLTLFLTMYMGLGMRMRYDYVLYLIAGLLPIIMFITAVAVFALNPDKRKRINVNFRFYVIIRCLIMIQVAVVIYCVNLIWGMPVAFSASYIPSLVLPLAYALFIPISEVIFMALLKSTRYAVE